MVILKFALLRFFRNPATMFASLILPTFLMFVSVLWEPVDYTTGFMPVANRGYYLIAMVMLFCSFPLTSGMTKERKDKTIVRIMSTPTTNFSYLAQNLVACMVPLLLQIVAVISIGLIRYDWSVSFAFWLGLLYILFAATSIGFCFAWNCLFKNADASYTVLSIFLTFASFILLMPLSIFPDLIRTIFMLFPTYWIATGIEGLISYGVNFELNIATAVLALFVIIFLSYGSNRGVY